MLWWPRNNAVIKGLRWRRTPMTFDNLHHMIGFWVCVPLAVLSLTGVYISFPQTARTLFGQPALAAPQRARATPAPPLASPILPIDRAVGLALAGQVGAHVRSITLPTEGKQPAWRIEVQQNETSKALRVEDATGQVRPDRGGGRGARDPVSRLMRQVHDGSGAPPIWQAIIALAGAAPAVLGLTGAVMWLRKQTRKARVEAREPAVV
jgi:uncharacterized iron-regulated membrane protein